MIEERERLRVRRARPASFAISGWGILFAAACFIAAILLITRNGCDNDFAGYFRVRTLSVDTWPEWCDYLNNVNLHTKYGALSVSYEPDSIRADFVRKFPTSLAQTMAGTYDSSARFQVWNDSTILHVACETRQDRTQWETALKEQFKADWSKLPSDQFLVNATIASLFTEAVLHGSKGDTTRLSMPYLFGR